MEGARRQLVSEAFGPDVDSVSKLRLARGLSQQQLAAAMETSQSHIAKIEAGQVRLYFETAKRLARALNVGLDQIEPLLPGYTAPALTTRGSSR
ncbi:helix-turn-helix domain-containing protein [Cupriavidus pampae]